AKYDVLVFEDGAIPGMPGAPGGGRGGGGGGIITEPPNLPAEYRGQSGRVTAERTVPRLREYIVNGGTVVAIGNSAANLAAHLQLPVENHLMENGAPLPRTKFYVPGSVLSVRVENTHPVAYGMPERADMFFNASPVFRLGAGA